MPFIENDNLPLSSIHDGFKSRLVQLAPSVILPKLTATCLDIRSLCLQRHKVHHYLFITDNQKVYDAALADIYDNYLKSISNFYTIFKSTRYMFDGPVTFDPRWDSVVHVDALELKRPLYIEETLILHCKDVETYAKVIPLISGRYNRVVMYGVITWDQFKKLLHGSVNQVRIEGRISVNPLDYDDVVDFIQRFCHGFMYKFSFHDQCFNQLLMQRLIRACNHHESHKLVRFFSPHTHFIHKNYRICFFPLSILLFVANLMFFIVAEFYYYNLYYSSNDEVSLFEYLANLLLFMTVFQVLNAHFSLAFNFCRNPNDRDVISNNVE